MNFWDNKKKNTPVRIAKESFLFMMRNAVSVSGKRDNDVFTKGKTDFREAGTEIIPDHFKTEGFAGEEIPPAKPFTI